MSARKAKHRVLRLMHSHLHKRFVELDAELQLWDRLAPIGREFGSPDFERLHAEDIQRWLSENQAKR